MFEKESVLTLSDNNKYVVVDKYNDNNTTYVYLVDMDNNSNIIYGKLENDEIVEIDNVEELEKVVKQVAKNIKDSLK